MLHTTCKCHRSKYCRYIVSIIAVIFLIGCNQRNDVSKAEGTNIESIEHNSVNLKWLRDIKIKVDTLITDTVPNAFHKKGVYLDSLQIQKLISDKIPERMPETISSIRLFAIKELSDSLTLCGYVYEFSDIEDLYGLIYDHEGNITDVIKFPIPSTSDIENVVDNVEYIYYFESDIEFTDNHNFIVIERSSTKGYDNNNGECVFETSLTTKTFYSISLEGKIKKGEVVNTQSCQG